MGGRQFYGLNEIGQIAVTVRNLDRAVEFYREKLGLRFLFQVPSMAFFDCAGVRLMLSLPEDEEIDHSSSILYFRVGDIEATTQNLTDGGVIFKTQPHITAKMEDQTFGWPSSKIQKAIRWR